MITVLVSVLALVFVWLLIDRVGRWAARRGWIYWGKKHGSALGAIGGALHPIWNPATEHVLEERRFEQDDILREEDGAPPSFDPRTGRLVRR
jgi:hypothetical protein